MIDRHRGILTGMALVGLLVAGAALVLVFARRTLPDPSRADRQQLLRWLVVRDLADEAPATRLVLAQRLETEFAEGIDWEATGQRLDDAHRHQLWNNIPLVLGAWLGDKAAAYDRLPSEERRPLLDACLKTLDAWRPVEALRPASVSPSGGSPSGLLMTGVESCKAQATSQQCEVIDRFVVAVQTHWLAKKLERFFPVGP